MINIFFGSSGRLGSLLLDSNLINGSLYLYKKTEWSINHTTKINEKELFEVARGREFRFIDLSIDYSSIENLLKHEMQKRELLMSLSESAILQSYIGISSGAAQFPLHIIKNEYYRKYAENKKSNVDFLKLLKIPVFYPQLFTLIGLKTFSIKSLGWVSVSEQARKGGTLIISDPYENRTWASESTVLFYMSEFLRLKTKSYYSGILDNEFCLKDIVDITCRYHDVKCEIRQEKKEKWLPVAYTNQFSTDIKGNEKLEDLLIKIFKEVDN